MCSAARPENGADSEPIFERRRFRVLLEDREVPGPRWWVEASGIGPIEARRIAEYEHPEARGLRVEEIAA